MDKMDIDDIIFSKLAGEVLTPAEEAMFEEWYGGNNNHLYYDSLLRIQAGAVAGKAGEVNAESAWLKRNPPRRINLRRKLAGYAAAAVVAIGIGTGLYFALDRIGGGETEIQPGEFKALLIGPAGEEIYLSESMMRTAEDGSVIFTNSENDGLEYNSDLETEHIIYNKLVIPRGGFYKVTLSDGTVAWLNSATHLDFPVKFGEGERRVELEGEAYFIVASDESRPFVVTTGDYDVRVTGTEFNIKSYTTGTTATTLVEGSVQVETEGVVNSLRPGQQAAPGSGGISVRRVNTEDYTAWHKGEFSFSLSRLEEIMEELSRWYDIDIEFEDPSLKDMRFSAWFSRGSSISEITGVLEKTNKICLELKGRTLVVKPT